MTVGATVVSRIITTLLKKNLSHLGFDRSAEKLKELETKFVQLKLELETVESLHRYRSDELLPKLRSSFYEAEDILDDVEYYRLKRQILSQPDDKLKSGSIRHRRNWMKKLPSALPKLSCLKKQMSGTISSDAPTDISKRKLKKLLNNIENNINDAHKLKTGSTNSRSAVTTAAPPPVVIGRERDRDHIMAMLLNLGEPQPASNDSDLSYSIIGIHGIFGSGKSTLAQYICASFRDMHYRFDLIMWVHVSQNFSVDDIFSKMLEEATGKPCPEFKCLNTLERRLKEELGAKRFLLVLDDVWFSKDDSLQKLQKIVSSLNVGYTRSKILVTSQTADALLALGAWRCIPIPDLNDSDFFQLFMHCALEGANIDKQDRRKFEVIGADIAKKLRRSPLAARTVGAQLRIRPNINFWRDACHRDLLNETIGALWSSYQHLDEQLWRCFAYCGIFPRGHRLQRNEIINMWVAQGFIKTTDASEDMEDVGERYFDELVSYSFLLPAEKLSGMLFDIESFTVNDLLHVVAEKVAGSECFRIEDGWSGECPKDVCHLFVQTYIGAQIIEKISKLENLRTLVIYTDNGDQLIDDNIFESIFIRLRKLRVLNVQSGSYESYHVFSVPASIGQLKRLRYFSFGFSQLTLPSTFSKLYHMQVLDFGTCGNVAFSSVEDMANLINLRHITLLQSHADFSFPNINRLTLLKTLPFYTVRKEQGYGIQQLEHLNKLRGRLQICGLENVQSKEEAVKAKLADKEGLTDLALYWDDDKCDPYVQPEVLEGLCPPMNIAKLTIGGYYGWKYPNWMVAENGPNYLEELELYRCDLEPGPKLYNFFAHLRSLRLRECSWPALPDFMQDLTELTDLIIDGCMNHQRFDLPALPQSLNYFQIENCNDDFMTSCTTIGHPNWEKVKGIPNLIIGNETIRHPSDNSEGLQRRVTSVRKHATIPNW